MPPCKIAPIAWGLYSCILDLIEETHVELLPKLGFHYIEWQSCHPPKSGFSSNFRLKISTLSWRGLLLVASGHNLLSDLIENHRGWHSCKRKHLVFVSESLIFSGRHTAQLLDSLARMIKRWACKFWLSVLESPPGIGSYCPWSWDSELLHCTGFLLWLKNSYDIK